MQYYSPISGKTKIQTLIMISMNSNMILFGIFLTCPVISLLIDLAVTYGKCLRNETQECFTLEPLFQMGYIDLQFTTITFKIKRKAKTI